MSVQRRWKIVIYRNNMNKDSIFYKYNSILLDYLIKNYNYDKSPLIYSKKYTNGFFTITKPNNKYKNCKFINGYPHFNIPNYILLEEINNFINNRPLYDKNIVIRYGDTHLYNPIPKLNQVRNLIIADMFNSMILTSGKKNIIYTICDIDRKSLKKIVEEINLNDTDKMIEELNKYIVSGNCRNQEYLRKWYNLNLKTKKDIIKFLRTLNLKIDKMIFESKLYKNRDIYIKIKNDIIYKNGIRQDGTFKYPLQELMFILATDKARTSVLNIIGDDQVDHILKVMDILDNNNLNTDVSFLTYGICKNGDSRNIEVWSKKIEEYIKDENIVIDNEQIKYQDYLKIIVATQGNNREINFNDLSKYKQNFEKFKYVYNSKKISYSKRNNNNKIIKNGDLIKNMALGNYYLNLAIKSGEQNKFFTYLYTISKEYMRNIDKYDGKLYYNFISKGLQRLNLNDIEICKRKEMNKYNEISKEFER